jgi:hypothetical protein
MDSQKYRVAISDFWKPIILIACVIATVWGVTDYFNRKRDWIEIFNIQSQCEGYRCHVIFQALNRRTDPLNATFHVLINAMAYHITAGRGPGKQPIAQGGAQIEACLDSQGPETFELEFRSDGMGADRWAKVHATDISQGCVPSQGKIHKVRIL